METPYHVGPKLCVRCPRCGGTVDTGYRLPASPGVMGPSKTTTKCPQCQAQFQYSGSDTFNA